MILDKMTNNYYKILSFMYDKVVIVDNENLIPLTQNEISLQTGINKVSINKFFSEYFEDGLLRKNGSRYYLTEKCIRIMKKIKAIKE